MGPTASKTSGNQGTLTGVFSAIQALLRNGATKTSALTITRPNDTTQYAIGDVISANSTAGNNNPMEEVTLGGVGKWLVGGQAMSSVAQSTLQFDCLFFKNPFSIAPDNSPFAPTDEQLRDNYLGRISFASFFALSLNSICDGLPASTKPIATQGTSVWMVRVATFAYTPGAQERITAQFDYQKG